MKLQTLDFHFAILTPCFSGTAEGKHAEESLMHVPPMRGHFRFWHRQLFGSADCNTVWGSTDGDLGSGSKIAVRLVQTVPASPFQDEVLPHKENPRHRRGRPALRDESEFTVALQRLVGCTDAYWDHAQRTLNLWLLIGCIGLRSNRAAGSVWPTGNWVPRDAVVFSRALRDLGLASWSVALIGEKAGLPAAKLRETASDTIQGNQYRQIFGGINERFPSPTKFKVIHLSTGPCLLAAAARQEIVCEDRQRRPILREAERLLLHVKPDRRRWVELGAWNHILP
ncbi:MAG: hypothetical protein L0Z50_12770 [Verrucomicrobiales bacterium]|nr:hypothetical protein [Verrucomicrobiales bacterium]